MENIKLKITPELAKKIIKIVTNPVLSSIFAKSEIGNDFFYLKSEPIENIFDFEPTKN